MKHRFPQAHELEDSVERRQSGSQLDSLGHQRVFSVDDPAVIKGYQFLPDPPEHVFTPVLDKTALGILRTGKPNALSDGQTAASQPAAVGVTLFMLQPLGSVGYSGHWMQGARPWGSSSL